MAIETQGIHRAVLAALNAIEPPPIGGVHRQGFAPSPPVLPRIIYHVFDADDTHGGFACRIAGDVVVLVEVHGTPLTDPDLQVFEKLANQADNAMEDLEDHTEPGDTDTLRPPVYINGFYRESPIDRPTTLTDADGNKVPVRAVGGLYRSEYQAL